MVDAPDWYAGVSPIRPVLGSNQLRYMGTAAGNVAGAGGTASLNISPPAGYNLIVSYLAVSTTESVIDYVYLQIDATTYFWHYFDVSCFLPFPTEGAPTVAEGSTLTITTVNNHADTQQMRISVGGMLEIV